MDTETLITRYRDQGGLNTSALAKAIRMDAEERGNRHWHRMGERCWCGFLGVPCRFHIKGHKLGVPVMGTQEEAEAAYLEWGMREHQVKGNLPVEDEEVMDAPEDIQPRVTREGKLCNTCNKPFTNRGALCNACRQKAYRERRSD